MHAVSCVAALQEQEYVAVNPAASCASSDENLSHHRRPFRSQAQVANTQDSGGKYLSHRYSPSDVMSLLISTSSVSPSPCSSCGRRQLMVTPSASSATYASVDYRAGKSLALRTPVTG